MLLGSANMAKKRKSADEENCLPIAKRITRLSIAQNNTQHQQQAPPSTSGSEGSSGASRSPLDLSPDQLSFPNFNSTFASTNGVLSRGSGGVNQGHPLTLTSSGTGFFYNQDLTDIDAPSPPHLQSSSGTPWGGGLLRPDLFEGVREPPLQQRGVRGGASEEGEGGVYEPEMDADVNPHYYHANQLLFEMNRARMERLQQHPQ